MTLTQLKYFCEVARTRHFTAAANNLFVAQSSLSYAIRELESELEAPLFIRQPNKSIDLTDFGKTLLPFAEAGIKMIEDGKHEIECMRSPIFGKVKINFFFSVALTIVPTLIRRFQEANPESQINFDFEVNHNWTDLSELLTKGQCDMVISASKIEGGYTSLPIASQKLVLLLPANHPLTQKSSIQPRDLANETLIAIDANSNLDKAVKHIFKAEGISPNMIYVSDWTAQQLSVSIQRGIAISSDIPVDNSLLTKRPIDSPLAMFPLYLTWPKKRKLSQATALVRDFLINLSETTPPEELMF